MTFQNQVNILMGVIKRARQIRQKRQIAMIDQKGFTKPPVRDVWVYRDCGPNGDKSSMWKHDCPVTKEEP